MSERMQNLVILMEPALDGDNVSEKAGNMILNRFCIDEDAAIELSGVNYLKEASWTMSMCRQSMIVGLVNGLRNGKYLKSVLRGQAKGTEYFYSISRKFTCQE